MKVVAFVGMPGAGKSLTSEAAKETGMNVLRLGDLTDEELRKRGLDVTEANERLVRESLRKELGMDVYAKRVVEKADASGAEEVFLDGARSWAEIKYLRGRYGMDFRLVSVVASPETRYERLMGRKERGLTRVECVSRDEAELENLDLGSSIAMGDAYIVNEGLSKEEFKVEVKRALDLNTKKVNYKGGE